MKKSDDPWSFGRLGCTLCLISSLFISVSFTVLLVIPSIFHTFSFSQDSLSVAVSHFKVSLPLNSEDSNQVRDSFQSKCNTESTYETEFELHVPGISDVFQFSLDACTILSLGNVALKNVTLCSEDRCTYQLTSDALLNFTSRVNINSFGVESSLHTQSEDLGLWKYEENLACSSSKCANGIPSTFLISFILLLLVLIFSIRFFCIGVMQWKHNVYIAVSVLVLAFGVIAIILVAIFSSDVSDGSAIELYNYICFLTMEDSPSDTPCLAAFFENLSPASVEVDEMFPVYKLEGEQFEFHLGGVVVAWVVFALFTSFTLCITPSVNIPKHRQKQFFYDSPMMETLEMTTKQPPGGQIMDYSYDQNKDRLQQLPRAELRSRPPKTPNDSYENHSRPYHASMSAPPSKLEVVHEVHEATELAQRNRMRRSLSNQHMAPSHSVESHSTGNVNLGDFPRPSHSPMSGMKSRRSVSNSTGPLDLEQLGSASQFGGSHIIEEVDSGRGRSSTNCIQGPLILTDQADFHRWIAATESMHSEWEGSKNQENATLSSIPENARDHLADLSGAVAELYASSSEEETVVESVSYAAVDTFGEETEELQYTEELDESEPPNVPKSIKGKHVPQKPSMMSNDSHEPIYFAKLTGSPPLPAILPPTNHNRLDPRAHDRTHGMPQWTPSRTPSRPPPTPSMDAAQPLRRSRAEISSLKNKNRLAEPQRQPWRYMSHNNQPSCIYRKSFKTDTHLEHSYNNFHRDDSNNTLHPSYSRSGSARPHVDLNKYENDSLSAEQDAHDILSILDETYIVGMKAGKLKNDERGASAPPSGKMISMKRGDSGKLIYRTRNFERSETGTIDFGEISRSPSLQTGVKSDPTKHITSHINHFNSRRNRRANSAPPQKVYEPVKTEKGVILRPRLITPNRSPAPASRSPSSRTFKKMQQLDAMSEKRKKWLKKTWWA